MRRAIRALLGVEPGADQVGPRIGDLEQVPLRAIEYRGVTLREMDIDPPPLAPLWATWVMVGAPTGT